MKAQDLNFIKSNYKIVNKLFVEGNKELALKLLEVTNEIGAIYSVPRCPVCNQEIKDITSQEYLFAVGECLNCDHVRGDL